MVRTTNTLFNDVRFSKCKMLGIHFEDCNKFIISINFNSCQLNLSSFTGLNLKGTRFTDCRIAEADFFEADLKDSVFHNCDLQGCLFENTNLENADLRTSVNYSIDPDMNNIRKAKFSWPGIIGLLSKFDIEIES